MAILDQLLEKKDVELYLKFRMEFLKSIEHEEKMKLPESKRGFIDERFKGRHDELRKLLLIITNGTLKDNSKSYYHKLNKNGTFERVDDIDSRVTYTSYHSKPLQKQWHPAKNGISFVDYCTSCSFTGKDCNAHNCHEHQSKFEY